MPRDDPELPADGAATRRYWDAIADDYQATHGPHLRGAAWGVWQLPEDELRILGEVQGKDVLELGCGAAQWSIALSRLGARCVGLDASARQLAHARAAGAGFPLLHASAEAVPLPDASFDLIVSDHGAFSWADPRLVVPEAARLLRRGGLLAFNVTTPWRAACLDERSEAESDRLQRGYFETFRLAEEGGAVSFVLPYGDWIRLLAGSGLVVRDLVELRAPSPEASSSYGWDAAWSRRWPAENVWVAEKAAAATR